MKINIQKDFYNHQWVIYYGDIKQTVDFFKSDDYLEKMINKIIQNHRNKQLKDILS